MAARRQINVRPDVHESLCRLAGDSFGTLQNHADAALRLYLSLPREMQALLLSGASPGMAGAVMQYLIDHRMIGAVAGEPSRDPPPSSDRPLPYRPPPPTPPRDDHPPK